MDRLTIGQSDPPQPGRMGSDAVARIVPYRLVRLRELHRMTQAFLAERSQISRSQLNALESGHAQDSLVSTIERLSIALEVTPNDLLGYDGSPAERGRCAGCGKELRPRELHLAADCMTEMASRGRSRMSIAALVGISELAVEAILREEHQARRHRRW